jgi:HK97 family phage prohead protease
VTSAPSWQLGEERRAASAAQSATRPAMYRAVAADSYSISSNGNAAGEGMTLTGRFAVYGVWNEINSATEGHFVERIQAGSFSKSIKERGARIPVMFSHGRDPVVGLQILGSVRELVEDRHGVRYTVDLYDGLPQLLLEGLRRGSYGASFRARPVKEQFTARPGRSPHNPTGLPESVVTELALSEFGPTSLPAYTDTTAEVRSVTDQYTPGVRLAAEVPKTQRALPEPLPSWQLGADEPEPYWKLNRKDQHGLTSAHQN